MNLCFFVSDLHGKISKYEALTREVIKERPDFVLLGGDLLPHKSIKGNPEPGHNNDFVTEFMFPLFLNVKKKMECAYPEILIIPGNDDPALLLKGLQLGEKENLWINLHGTSKTYGKYRFIGYPFVPPTPFPLKDWEKYDCDYSVPKGSTSPENGFVSSEYIGPYSNPTIYDDLEWIAKENDLTNAIILFHSPPYDNCLDVIGYATEQGSQAETYIHVGSKAITLFIEKHQPYITLHGHIHESTSITGNWRYQKGSTWAFGGAHDGPELALVKFELHAPRWAERILIST